MSFTDVFGGTAVKPSQPSYELLTISANTNLQWPLEGGPEGNPYVATQIDVNATVGALSVLMPNAEQGALGQQTVVTNIGANTFTLKDSTGTQIQVIAAGVSYLITLTSNTTPAGTWRSLELASTASTAVASALAGYGLQALLTQLQVNTPTVPLAINSTIVANYRGSLIKWTGGAGTLQLDTIANLGVGFSCSIYNDGTNVLTITGSGGQTINGLGNLLIPIGNSATIVAEATDFITEVPPSQAVFNFTGITLQSITSSGTYTPTAGTKFAIVIITGPGGSGAVYGASNGVQAGGAGETAIGVFTGAQVSPTVTVTIGAGGAAVVVSPSAGNNGSAASSFGSLLTASYGLGGAVDTANPALNGGTGGTGSGIHVHGGTGAFTNDVTNGGAPPGGASFWGSGGAPGSGGYARQISGGTSGAGTAGFCMILELQ